MKAGTHSAFGEESHTAAHTAKHGPSLPRPQHGLVLPAKSPPKEQPEEADARLWRVSASSGVAAPLGCVIFSVSVEIAARMPCAQGLSVCARRGVVSLPSERSTRFGNPAWPGFKTANFAAFGSWPGVLPKNAESLRDSDAHDARRCPEASRPRWAA